MVDRLGPELAEPVFDRVAIVGVGLIGSSIARAARRVRAAGAIVLADASLEVLRRAEAIALEVGPALKPGAVVSDVGSVKTDVIAAIAPHLPEHAYLVPAHPVAGT